jgi:uncharacterized protein YbbC (DUF1343 family)
MPHSPAVKTGLDVLVDEGFARLSGLRVALLGNPAAVDKEVTHLLDRCLAHGVKLVKLFGPEHGLTGDAQDMAHVASGVDARTGLPVKSLYGATRESLFMQPTDLEGVDVLVCDLQDVGSRYYTFSYTIAFAMRAAAKAGVRVIVLDRPNPIDGVHVEGNLVDARFRSFVGEYALPIRPGLTMGELCAFFADVDVAELGIPRVDLEIVKMRGWRRDMLFGDTGLPWVLPSPNMPTPDTALVYPGGCLYEGTNLSEGRGTTRPFELVGAPYIDDAYRFADLVRAEAGAGVDVRPCGFTPMFQKHANTFCGGVQLHVTDKATFDATRAGVAVLHAARTFAGFDWRRSTYEYVSDRLAVDLLFGDDRPRKALDSGAHTNDVMAILDEQRAEILSWHASKLLYPLAG